MLSKGFASVPRRLVPEVLSTKIVLPASSTPTVVLLNSVTRSSFSVIAVPFCVAVTAKPELLIALYSWLAISMAVVGTIPVVKGIRVADGLSRLPFLSNSNRRTLPKASSIVTVCPSTYVFPSPVTRSTRSSDRVWNQKLNTPPGTPSASPSSRVPGRFSSLRSRSLMVLSSSTCERKFKRSSYLPCVVPPYPVSSITGSKSVLPLAVTAR